MNFSIALENIKKYSKLARKHWIIKNRYIQLHKSINKQQADYIEVFDNIHYGPWSPTHCDLLAEDWEIIECLHD